MAKKKMHMLEIRIELTKANGGGDTGRFFEVNAAAEGSSTQDFNGLVAGNGAKAMKFVSEILTKVQRAYGRADTIEVCVEGQEIVSCPEGGAAPAPTAATFAAKPAKKPGKANK